MTWREFWDRDRTTYVNERHRQLESQLIGRAIESFIPGKTATVLDYGCGDSRVGDELVLRCGRLILCDVAPSLLDRLKARYAGNPRVAVVTPRHMHGLPDAFVD